MNHSTLSHAAPAPNKAEIQQAAYHLWIDGGRLEGVELDNWLAAKELLRPRQGRARGYGFRSPHRRGALGPTPASS